MLNILLAVAFLPAQTPSHALLGSLSPDTARHSLLDLYEPPGPFDDGLKAASRARRLPQRSDLPLPLALLWPADVDPINGLKLYQPTRYSQSLTVQGGRSSTTWHKTNFDLTAPDGKTLTNPNRIFPYSVPGGLHNSTGWMSMRAAKIPGPVERWVESTSVPLARTPLPKVRWRYPPGTVFVDMLYKDGVCFELRTATKKEDGKWDHEAVYRDHDAAPGTFHGAGMACASCHKDAGQSQGYGVTVRGDDFVFSYNPFIEGSFQVRDDVETVERPSALRAAPVSMPAPVITAPPPAAPVFRVAQAPMMRRAQACST
jgi:hypothetical protein